MVYIAMWTFTHHFIFRSNYLPWLSLKGDNYHGIHSNVNIYTSLNIFQSNYLPLFGLKGDNYYWIHGNVKIYTSLYISK